MRNTGVEQTRVSSERPRNMKQLLAVGLATLAGLVVLTSLACTSTSIPEAIQATGMAEKQIDRAYDALISLSATPTMTPTFTSTPGAFNWSTWTPAPPTPAATRVIR